MWKKFLCAAAVCSWTVCASGAAELHLKLGGGISLFSPDDVNRAISDWGEASRLEAERRNNWSYISGKSPAFRSGIGFEGELVISLSSLFSLSVGSGFLYGELRPEDTEVRILKPLGETVLALPATMSAVPLVASVYIHVPLHSRIRVYARVGAGQVWATYVEREGSRRDTAEKFGYTREDSAKTRSPVCLGGLGIDFRLEDNIRFFLEGTYRSLRLSGFTGEGEGGQSGTLYFLEEYSAVQDFWQAKHRLSPQAPTGAEVRAVRETEVDLSGVSLTLGVIIRF